MKNLFLSKGWSFYTLIPEQILMEKNLNANWNFLSELTHCLENSLKKLLSERKGKESDQIRKYVSPELLKSFYNSNFLGKKHLIEDKNEKLWLKTLYSQRWSIGTNTAWTWIKEHTKQSGEIEIQELIWKFEEEYVDVADASV